jgi:hypothetical protein
VKLIHRAGHPLTVKQLSEEIRRRRFPTTSKNIPQLVQNRVSEMAKKGILAHASGQPGYVVRSPNGQQQEKTRTRGGQRKVAKPRAGGGVRGTQPPLMEVLTKILAQAKEPMGGGELAEKVLATGYKSTSKRFRDVVWVSLGQMENVEHIRGEGYRLKKR